MKHTSSLALLGVVGAALVGTTACESRTRGDLGNFVFSYKADDDVTNFNKPIAPGAKLNIEVNQTGTNGAPVALETATTDPETVMKVNSFSGHEIIIEGVADGEVELRVSGPDSDGEVVEDKVDMLVRTPTVHKMWHHCDRDNATAAYLVDSRVRIGFDFEEDDGEPVIGYGWYPVTVSDGGAFSIVASESTQSQMVFDTGNAAADVTVTSDIDGTALTSQVVTRAMIDGVSEPIGFVVEDIDVGEEYGFYVLPKVGESVVCQSTAPKTVTSDTPEICSITEIEPPENSDWETGWFKIKGESAGECMFTVTYPDGNGGEGASAQFDYTIEP